MATISILVVEDELIIAEDIKNQLIKLGYRVTAKVKSYNSAIDALNKELPDLVLVDIKLKGVKDGIHLAKTIKENYHLPVVFLTSHADQSTVERVKEVEPEGYLLKPFEKDDLYTSIELALSNFIKRTQVSDAENLFDEGSQVFNNSIFVRQDHLLVKIRFEELKWIKAEGNYLELHCSNKKLLIRFTLKDFLKKLPENIFYQVHRSYAVNIEYLSAVGYTSITIDDEELPVGRSYAQALRKVLSME